MSRSMGFSQRAATPAAAAREIRSTWVLRRRADDDGVQVSVGENLVGGFDGLRPGGGGEGLCALDKRVSDPGQFQVRVVGDVPGMDLADAAGSEEGNLEWSVTGHGWGSFPVARRRMIRLRLLELAVSLWWAAAVRHGAATAAGERPARTSTAPLAASRTVWAIPWRVNPIRWGVRTTFPWSKTAWWAGGSGS